MRACLGVSWGFPGKSNVERGRCCSLGLYIGQRLLEFEMSQWLSIRVLRSDVHAIKARGSSEWLAMRPLPSDPHRYTWRLKGFRTLIGPQSIDSEFPES